MFKIIPDLIFEKIRNNQPKGKDEFFVFFVDIKGFTNITENLMKNDFKGSETLSEIINSFFGELIKIVYLKGGDILNFAGDAFTGVIKEDGYSGLIDIVDSILAFSKEKGRIKTLDGEFELSFKIGVSFGDLEWAILGDVEKIYYFKGEPINVAAKMEKFCGENEAVFSLEAKKFFSEELFTNFKDVYKYNGKKDIFKKEGELNSEEIDEKILKSFIYTDLPKEFGGEFRDVASMFISFDGVDEKDQEEFLLTVFELSKKYKGYFDLVDFGDKGGKIFIIFGAPKSYENDLKRGLMLFYDKKLDRYRNFIKSGLTYGKVYAGYVGSPVRSTYTVLGDRVNVSARIMVESDYGEVCVDWFTEEFLGTSFRTVFKKEKLLKGKSEKEKIFKVLNEEIFDTKIYFENEIVGREKEIEVVENSLKLLSEGKNGGCVYIFGDAGVGKSRICFEIVSRNSENFQFLIFKNENVDKEEFSSIKRFLFDFFKQDRFLSKNENRKIFDTIFEDRKTKENLKETFKFLLNLVDQDSAIYKLNRKNLEEEIFFSLKEFFIFLCQKKPLVIIVEDLQYQDEKSNQFFEILSREVENYPFMIIFTSRYDYDGSKKLLNLYEKFPVQVIELKNFDYVSCKSYIENQLIFSPSEDTVRFIFERTEGNPFYVEQFSIYLLENDFIKNENGKNVISKEIKNIPSTISSIIIARIDRLNAELKSLVEKSSVIGYEVENEVLKRVVDVSDFEEGIEKITRENILLKINEIKLIFKHSLIKDTVYNMILKKKLKEYHLIVGEVMEKLFINDEERFKDIAFHYEKGENFEKAKIFYRKSGDYSHKKFRFSDGLNFYKKALNYAFDFSEKLSIRINFLRMEMLLGMWIDAKKDYEQILNEIVDYPENELKAEILKDYGDLLFQMGFYEECEKYLDKSYEIFVRFKDKEKIADILSIKGQILWRKNEYKKAMENVEKILEIVDENSDPETYANAFLTKGNIAKDMGDYDESVKNYEVVLKVAKKNNLLLTLNAVYGNLGLINWMKGDFEKALSYYLENEKIMKDVNSKTPLSYLYGNLGALYYSLKDYTKAEDYFSKQLKISRELNDRKSIRIVLNNLGGIANIKGDYVAESEFYKESLKIAEDLGDRKGKRTVLSNLGQLYGLLGDFDVSVSYLKESIEIAKQIDDKMGIALNNYYLSQTYFINNLFELSLKHVEEALSLLEEIELKQYYYHSLLLKGEILLKMGDFENGLKLLDEGIEFLKSRKEYEEYFVKYTLLKLFYEIKDENEFIDKVKDLIFKYDEESIKGEIYYTLYKKTKREDFRKEALKIYEKFYEKFKNYNNFLRLEELTKDS